MDHLSPQQRSAAMARVKSANTSAEKRVQAALESLGIEYSLHRIDLPGTPDVTISGLGRIIFVNGCFWHMHGCRRVPRSNRTFWKQKFDKNKVRDARVNKVLRAQGWHVMTI